MFKSISWQDFLTGISVILGAYYAVSILALYSRDGFRWLKSKSGTSENSEAYSEKVSANVMGAIKSELPRKNVQSIQSEDLVVGDSSVDQNDTEDSFIVGSVSNILHEVKVLSRVIKESGGAKDEGVPMFQSLLSNYPQLLGTKYQESITVFIHQHCSSEGVFKVELNEVSSWWPVNESQNNQNNSEYEK